MCKIRMSSSQVEAEIDAELCQFLCCAAKNQSVLRRTPWTSSASENLANHKPEIEPRPGTVDWRVVAAFATCSCTVCVTDAEVK